MSIRLKLLGFYVVKLVGLEYLFCLRKSIPSAVYAYFQLDTLS